MKIEKVKGFLRIYQVEVFPEEFSALFGKGTGEYKRYLKWLYVWLKVLDDLGMKALQLEQFEHIKATNPRLYAIRHPKSRINERYLYVFVEDEAALLLTAFKEKSSKDYTSGIKRAHMILTQLEESGEL